MLMNLSTHVGQVPTAPVIDKQKKSPELGQALKLKKNSQVLEAWAAQELINF